MRGRRELGRVLGASRHEHLAPPIAIMVVALPIRPELRVGEDIVSMRLGKAVAGFGASVWPRPGGLKRPHLMGAGVTESLWRLEVAPPWGWRWKPRGAIGHQGGFRGCREGGAVR